MKPIISLIGILLFTMTSITHADFSEKYLRGDLDAAELLQLAEQGDIKAKFYLGLMYENGLSIKQDYREAFKWYLAAAEQGDAHAQFRTGFLYTFGQGVPQNNMEAFKWYRAAAEQGHSPSQLQLGHAYRHGSGVPQDLKKAYAWISIAVANGHNNSAILSTRAEIAKLLTSTELEKAQGLAKQYFEKYQPE